MVLAVVAVQQPMQVIQRAVVMAVYMAGQAAVLVETASAERQSRGSS